MHIYTTFVYLYMCIEKATHHDTNYYYPYVCTPENCWTASVRHGNVDGHVTEMLTEM